MAKINPIRGVGTSEKWLCRHFYCAWFHRRCYKRRMAVYTPLTNEQITDWLRAYGALGELEFAIGIAQGVENTNYLLALRRAGGEEKKYILTLYEKRTRPEDVPFFLRLMQHVAAKEVDCPQPIVRQDGALMGEIAGKHAALVSFLHGKSRSVIRNEHAAQVGMVLGKLHHAVADFTLTRANSLGLAGWQALYEKTAPRLDEIQPGLQQLVGDELQFLHAHWPGHKHLPRGIIHADLFPDNVFFTGDTVSGVIDFYFACDDFFAYDLAITINAWCFDGRECNLTKMRQLVKQYDQQRPLNDAEKRALPVLLRGAALRFLLTRAHDWLFHEKSALVTPKDPLEYVTKLRFHQASLERFA